MRRPRRCRRGYGRSSPLRSSGAPRPCFLLRTLRALLVDHVTNTSYRRKEAPRIARMSDLWNIPDELLRTPSRNCLKSPEGARNLASEGTEAALFGPFWPRHTDQNDAQSVVRTPFQTVSIRSSGEATAARSYRPLLR